MHSKSCSSMAGVEAKFTVCLVGAAGGIGQQLTPRLKENPRIKKLNLFDIAPTAGLAMDTSHINSPAVVTAYQGKDQMRVALTGADLVISVAGVTIKPGQTRDDIFPINCGILKGIALAIADSCPNALVAIVSNPVNSLVPLVVEVLKHRNIAGAERRVFGVCTLDVMRAATFAAALVGTDPRTMYVPVIGAHAGITIIPVLSQAKPAVALSHHQWIDYLKHVRTAANEVLDAYAGKGTAVVSMACAASRFANSLLLALSGQEGVTECTFVKSNVTAASFFSNPVVIGKHGVEKNLGLGTLTKVEQDEVTACLPELEASIKKGIAAAST